MATSEDFRWPHARTSTWPLTVLPPTENDSYTIVASVFSDSVTLMGSTSQVLELPRLGPCGPVSFRFRTPTDGTTVRIRIMLSYQRHLLQVLSLTGSLQGARRRGRNQVSVRLDFSRARQLTAIDEALEPRALAVAGNGDLDDRHRLMFDTGDGIPVDEVALAKIQTEYRTRLGRYFGEQHTAKMSNASFARFIREMAVQGRRIRGDMLSNGSEELQQRLLDIARSPGPETIQYLRLQSTFAFPWAIVYDWHLPASEAQRTATPVCLGVVNDAPCGCSSTTTHAICARGFWGIRHVIEEFVTNQRRDANDPIKEIAAGDTEKPIACTLGVVDRWSTGMVSTLESRFGAQIRRLSDGDSLMATMRSDATRPSVLVVVGHLTNKEDPDEPDPPRVTIEAAERFLYPQALEDERESKGRWESPYRPIVLLMACGSGADELGNIAGGFVARLANVGAAAVVACEEKIDTSLAADLSSWILDHLAQQGPGESLRTWRNQLLATQNPCGFLFSCFGNAHVTNPSLIGNTPPQRRDQ